MKVHYFQELKFSEEIPRYRDKNYYFKNKYHFWRKCFLSPGTEKFWFISDFWAISDCPERYEAIFATKIWKFSATCIKKGRLDQSWLFLHIQIFSDQFDKLFTAKKRARSDKKLRNQILFRKSRDDRRKFLFHIRAQNSRTKILMSYCLNFKAPHVHTVSFQIP